MNRVSGDPYNSLLSGSGVLTTAGQAYVQMPVHDPNIYYRIPGRLQAERYVTLNQADIAPTTDADGLADMRSTAAGGSLDYNIQVDAAGNYPLNLRVAGAPGQIRIYAGATLLATATQTQSTWSTISTTVALSAGAQTLHVVLAANAQRLNWIQFQPANGTVSTPTGLTATGGNSRVVLSWSPAGGALSYAVKSSTTNGGPYTTIAAPTTTTYTNNGLINGTTYYYVVSATDGVNTSSNSIQVSAVPTLPLQNLALNKPVSASSTQTGNPAANAVDGNTGTRWATDWSDPQWIYVDLQGTYNITEVKLNWEAAYGKSFQIQVSMDTTNWTNIYSTTTGTGGIPGLDRAIRSGTLCADERDGARGTLWVFPL